MDTEQVDSSDGGAEYPVLDIEVLPRPGCEGQAVSERDVPDDHSSLMSSLMSCITCSYQ